MAAPPLELLELRDIVLPLIKMMNVGANATCQMMQFLALHGLQSINNFNLIKPHQANDLVKASSTRHPAQSMGILVQNNLTELIWYVRDKQHSDERPASW
jgi:hypothetical protein